MDDEREQAGPARRWLPGVVIGLAVLGIVLVVVGRILDSGAKSGWQDPIYSVLLAFSVDGTFIGQQNGVTVIGAFAAALATYLAVAAGVLLLLRGRIATFRARRARRHFVVLGDESDAAALARQLSTVAPVVLTTPLETPGRVLSIARPRSTAELMVAANIHEARGVVAMRSDEKLNAALAAGIAGARRPGSDTAIWCRVGDRLIADRITSPGFGEPRVVVFDDAPIMAREALARHPAHAAAFRMAAGRVHLLVAGFGRLGEAMAEEAIFSGIAEGLGKPMVTVLDQGAAAAERSFRASRPALDLAADMAFIEADLVAAAVAPGLAAEAFARLAARDDIARVSGIALCLAEDVDNVRLALALPDLRHREGRYFAPTFMRVRDRDTCSVVLAEEAPDIIDPENSVIALERPTRLLATDIVDGARRDRAARLLHEAGYRRAGRSPGASADWARLPETYRRANRRGADHLAAKLAALGLMSDRDPHQPVTVSPPSFERLVAPLLEAGSDSGELDRLARLEHRRWVAERALDGWSPGTPRDDDRKVHPLMVDYAALPRGDQLKDHDQVKTVLSSVVAAEGGVSVETRLALAGHRLLAAGEERRGIAELMARLLPRLEQLPGLLTLMSPLAPGADLALAEAVAERAAGRRGGLRLVVPEVVPYRVVLDVAAAEAFADEDARTAFVGAALQRRHRLFRQFERVEIVRLGFPGRTDDSYRRDPAQFDRGVARANAYLARQAHLVALLWDGAPARGQGGTGELAGFCRDPAAIPADIEAGLHPPGAAAPPELIVVPVSR